MIRRIVLLIFVSVLLISCNTTSNTPDDSKETTTHQLKAVSGGAAGQQVVVNGQSVQVPSDFTEKAGEYFIENMLAADFDGSRFRETSRFVDNPVFWFKNGDGTVGKDQAKDLFRQGVEDFTGGKFEPIFYESSTPPGNPDTVITVEFSNTSSGYAIPEANWSNGGGITVTGGDIKLSNNFLQGISGYNRSVPVHELGHVMLGAGGHSGIPDVLMAQGGDGPELKPYEQSAWELFHRLPVGTSLNDLQQAGIITNAMLEVHPKIYYTRDKHTWPRGPDFEGAVGDTLYVKIGHARYPFRCGSSYSGWPEPIIKFNGVQSSFVIEPMHLVQHQCNWAKVEIPIGATSGPMTVTNYGRTSQPKDFTVISKYPDFTGIWETSVGKIKLYQISNYVIGDYEDKGIMVGKIERNCLHGTFTDDNTNGEFSMGINSAGGGEFAGLWMRDKMNGPKQWRGTRISKNVSSFSNFTRNGSSLNIIKNKRIAFDGTYGSNRGVVKFFQRDLLLIGDYRSDGIMAGMWEGNSFQGLFTVGNQTGWFDLAFFSKTGSFRGGEWGWLGEEGEAQWDLDRETEGTPWPDNMGNTLRCK